MVTRLIDFLKAEQVTSLFTSLARGDEALPLTDLVVSSLMDAWILLQDVKSNGERNRVLNVIKSRGMAHSNQAREFLFTSDGIDLVDTYLGPTGVMTGAARMAQEFSERTEALESVQERASRKAAMERKRAAFDRSVADLRAEQEAAEDEYRRYDEQVGTRARALGAERLEMGRARHADPGTATRAKHGPRNGRTK